MRHSPIIIPANERYITPTFWNCSWFSSKKNANILSAEDIFFKKWTFNFFYKKQKKIFSRVTSTEKKRKHFFSLMKVARKNTIHFVNILRTRRKVTNKTMNWVVHNIYITRTWTQTNLLIYLSCWMSSKHWTESRKLCSKWFISQCKKRFSVLNNQVVCRMFWIYPSYFRVPRAKKLDITNLRKLYILKSIFKNIWKKNRKKNFVLSYVTSSIQKTEYRYLFNETVYS
jgi:hypothetical protein